MGSATSGQVVLDCVRKQAMESNPLSSVPPWSLLSVPASRFLPRLLSVMECDLRVLRQRQTFSSPSCFMSWSLITAIETLTVTEIGTKITGYCYDQTNHVYEEGLWRCLQVWVGNVIESSDLNGQFSGGLEDKNWRPSLGTSRGNTYY